LGDTNLTRKLADATCRANGFRETRIPHSTFFFRIVLMKISADRLRGQ
jgi:hypothetical protein